MREFDDYPLLGQLCSMIPLLLVYLIGFLVAVLRVPVSPKASILTILALFLFFFVDVAARVAYYYPLHDLGFRDVNPEIIFLAMDTLAALGRALALGVLLIAVFVGRTRPQAPAAPHSYTASRS